MTSPGWRPDYLTVRVAPARFIEAPSEATDLLIPGELAVLNGLLVDPASHDQLGMLRNSHNALGIHLQGQWWERLAVAEQLEYAPELVRATIQALAPNASQMSVSRVDYCFDLPYPGPEAHLAIASRMFDNWPWPHRPATWRQHHSQTGSTYELGIAGHDPERMRERDTFVRIYTHTTKRPGVLRIELELKNLEGDLPDDQMADGWLRTMQLAIAAGLPTQGHRGPALPTLSTRKRASEYETFARIVGMTCGALRRLRGVTAIPEKTEVALKQISIALGLEQPEYLRALDKARKTHFPFTLN